MDIVIELEYRDVGILPNSIPVNKVRWRHPSLRNRFCEYFKKYDAKLTTMAEGCLIIRLVFSSRENVDRFWSDYITGTLQKEVEGFIFTDENLDKFNPELLLDIKISETEYHVCRKRLNAEQGENQARAMQLQNGPLPL